MNTNCPNCDRDQCPTLFATFARMPPSSSNRAMADCANHTVNWRARALTEAARADAAEARIAKLEAVLPTWHVGELDQWRETDYLNLCTFADTIIGSVVLKQGMWLAHSWGKAETKHDGHAEARRAVEEHLGLPPCEVLP